MIYHQIISGHWVKSEKISPFSQWRSKSANVYCSLKTAVWRQGNVSLLQRSVSLYMYASGCIGNPSPILMVSVSHGNGFQRHRSEKFRSADTHCSCRLSEIFWKRIAERDVSSKIDWHVIMSANIRLTVTLWLSKSAETGFQETSVLLFIFFHLCTISIQFLVFSVNDLCSPFTFWNRLHSCYRRLCFLHNKS